MLINKKRICWEWVEYLIKPIEFNLLFASILKVHKANIINTNTFVLNNSVIKDFFDDDNDMYNRAVKRFINNFKLYPDKLLSFLSSKNFKELKTLTHNIKSSSKMIGADKLHMISTKYDTILKNNSSKITLHNINEIIYELNVVIKYLGFYEEYKICG